LGELWNKNRARDNDGEETSKKEITVTVKRRKMSPILNATLWVEQFTEDGEEVGEYLNIQLLNENRLGFV
jgi:hypothetical protein